MTINRARTYIGLSALVTLGSLSISALIYYQRNPFIAVELAVSTLQSPDKNPAGFLIASAGPLVSAALLAPLAAFFYGRFRSSAPITATIGAGALLISVVAFCTNGVLSLDGYTGPLHGDLATLSFASAILAVLFLLHAGRSHNLISGRVRRPTIDVLLWLNYASLVVMFVFYIGPDYLGLTGPMKLTGIDPWHIIGASEVLFTGLAFISLLLLISVADAQS